MGNCTSTITTARGTIHIMKYIHDFKIGDKVRFTGDCITRIMHEVEHTRPTFDTYAYKIITDRKIHTVTNTTYDSIWIDNDPIVMTGNWRIDYFQFEKVNPITLDDKLFEL